LTVTLPLIQGGLETSNARCEHTEIAQLQPSEQGKLNGVRVLVVDDDRDTREVLSVMLMLEGAEVRVGATSGEAFEILDQWTPDVLVSDIGMPGQDGYNLIRTLRAREVARDGFVAALALTGYAGDEDVTRTREAGFQMHLPKPVESARLIAAVASLATLRGTSPQIPG
jgi:CheY-like chemotaxis protein